jgi:AraC family transcriptional regulator
VTAIAVIYRAPMPRRSASGGTPHPDACDTLSRVTLGQPLRVVEQDGFIVMASTYEPFAALNPHRHALANISLVRRGSFVERLRNRAVECLPFSLIAKPPDELHSDRFGSAGAICLHISFSDDRLSGWGTLSRAIERTPVVRRGIVTALILRLDRELRNGDSASGLVIEGLVFEVLAHLVRRDDTDHSRVPPVWLRRVRDLVHARYREHLGVGDVAADVGVHPGHLTRMFQRYYRCSLGEYARRRRIDAAVQLITASDTPLGEVAIAVGFYDQSHFTNTFKRYTGCTPAAVRVARRPDVKRSRRLS